MPHQCGGEHGCYKIAQSVSNFLKIFPPIITVEFLLFIFLFDLKTGVMNLVKRQQLPCQNKQHDVAMTVTPKNPCSVMVPADLMTTDQRKLMLCSIWSNSACVSQCAGLFQKLHPLIIETSQTKEYKHDHHIPNSEGEVKYHLLACQGTSTTDKCAPNK